VAEGFTMSLGSTPTSKEILIRTLVPVLAVALGLELLVLEKLDYSKGWLERIDLSEAEHPTHPLALGNLSWDPGFFVGNPELAPFAQMVREHCPRLGPIETARCLSDLLAERFPHGDPSQELFDRGFSPAADLQRHLEGQPGHCVTRSGIIATALLASGISARMVQLLPPAGVAGGHNSIEVFDPNAGWIYFDPSFGGELESSHGGRSAAALLAASGRPHWLQSGKTPAVVAGKALDWRDIYAGTAPPILAGHLVYPEPWLYTRVGARTAPAPFRARFLVVGPRSWRLSFGRKFILAGLLMTATALFVVSAKVALSFRRARRRASTALVNQQP
jgi:hypothetical protein